MIANHPHALSRRTLFKGALLAAAAQYARPGDAIEEPVNPIPLPETPEPAVDNRFRVVDLHCHPTLKSYMFKTKFWRPHYAPSGFFPLSMCVDIDALVAGGVKTFLCAAYVVERPMFSDVWPLGLLAGIHPRAKHVDTAPLDQLTREYLDEGDKMIAKTRQRRGEIVEIARPYADVERIHGEGKVCMLHAVEGAHHLNGNIDMVDELYARGVCQMIVPHLYPNEAGGCVDIFTEDGKARFALGCFSTKYQDDSGLTPWGRDLVEKLLDIGIIVDPTHGPREYRRQVIEIARNNSKKRPVIMSHVSVHNSPPSKMGPLPEDIKEIADTGGAIGLMMAQHRASSARDLTGIDSVLRAIDYLVEHGGEDVVAIGSDYDGFTNVPTDLRSPRDYKPLREAMLRKYTETQVAKFLAGNAERVLKTGWGK